MRLYSGKDRRRAGLAWLPGSACPSTPFVLPLVPFVGPLTPFVRPFTAFTPLGMAFPAEITFALETWMSFQFRNKLQLYTILLLLLFLQVVILPQVDVGRLHSDDGFVQQTEGFLHVSKSFLAPTSSQQCMRAMPSDRRIMLSSCRTVILQADLVTPPELSRCLRRLYCSTMNSSDSLEIYRCGTRNNAHLGFELPCKEQISADLIQRVQSVHRFCNARVQVHDASGDGVVRHLGYTHDQIELVHQDEEEVEAAHDGGGHVDVLLQTLAAVVAPAHRVGCSQDGGASQYLDSGLGDADGLLLHGLMDGHLVLKVHLVKLINAAHTLEENHLLLIPLNALNNVLHCLRSNTHVVSQHQSSGLDHKLAGLLVSDHSCRQTCSCARLPAVLGSPTMHKLTSPLSEMPSMVVLGTPPNSISRIPRFTSSLPGNHSRHLTKIPMNQFD
ncbi:hypothetical protein F7725_011766 [Dissostichus mawsoni]|uniref:Uncharacterized protein n=1 Tax=Dissostichus mawsoni TaxID=36200 RepID=A0A7J5Z9X3_DISMA|nr:hypothetical protein F7725_011766 [Dissostichus mawsoni]